MKKDRATLRAETARVTRNRLKEWERFNRTEKVSAHVFHKRKPYDCGNTQCGLCRDTWRKKEKVIYELD